MGEDIELIENLEYSKKLSNEIKIKVEIAQKTQVVIATSSEHYRVCADRGALIFFLMQQLYKMSSFYMYSLESFLEVIIMALQYVSEEMGHLCEDMKKDAPKEEGEKKQGEEGEGDEKKEEAPEGEEKPEDAP